MSSIIPKKLAIYYGWPSSVNATYTVAGAAAVFKDYDIVIFGAGLEDSGHGDHQNTIDIIAHQDMANTDVYGYITTSSTQASNETKIDNWALMGVKGIFCDEYGYDYGNSRTKQNDLVDYIHSKNLVAFVNAWNPDDAFSSDMVPVYNPNPKKSTKLNSNDWYLAESYQIINGNYQNASDWKTKADKMASYRGSLGTKMATITTTDGSAYSEDKFFYSAYSCSMYGFDACGWGEQWYSASSASLPFRTRPTLLGTVTDGSIENPSSGVYQRNTNVGLKLDTVNHTYSTILE